MASTCLESVPLLVADNSSASPAPEVHLSPAANSALTSTGHAQLQVSKIPMPELPVPPFFDSMAELKDISAAIVSFEECYEDLRKHLEYIKAAIAAKLPSRTPELAPPDTIATVPPMGDQPNQTPLELEGLCKAMSGRGLRKYLISHLSDLPRLRVELPKSLKLIPNAPKLVLECLGKFFLQGSAAFAKNASMIPAREASIFVLECFLLMMGMDGRAENENVLFHKDVIAEAELSALAWRKRLISEGGVHKASKTDARGLLLFVACFGIPALFKREDVRDLVNAANVKDIISALRNSGTFMDKISEIVDGMIKHKMEVDAVELIYTFGLEGRFNPQSILLSFLRESKESGKKQKRMAQGSASSVLESKKKQLSSFAAITECLGRHGIDVAKFLPGWQIKEKIAVLEKEIAVAGDRKPNLQKRKSSEGETSKRPKDQEAKRSRYSIHCLPHLKAASHANNRRSLLDSGQHGSYSASPSVVFGGPTRSYPPVGLLVDSAGQGASLGAQFAGYGDYAMNERYSQTPALGLTSLYRAPMEVFAGARDVAPVGVGSRQFADAAGAVPPSGRSSYFHQP